ncbi:hypothetical protein [Vibrio aphrogenes]|uniref:hypothetical protein n=1 Tax=Vibrio aphrogenes TaxID=1891186 RepID=UPI0013DF1F36|nr:hypothetical protein [Vibrio aphrogenes]
MWLALFFPSSNDIKVNDITFYSASPYGMPIILHQVDASNAKHPSQCIESFYA